MRILMLTDDAMSVDRRILLEAETLIDEGHEVIVLARDDGKTPSGKFMGRVKVEFIKSNSVKPPHLNLWQVPLLSLQNYIDKHMPIGSSLKSVARQILHYQGNFVGYISTQLERLADNWIPLNRRFGILARTFVGVILFGFFKIFTNIASMFVFHRKTPTGNFLDHPFQPHAWDSALIDRGIFYDPDLVFAHDLPQLFAGVAIKKRLKIPLVYDSHEIYSIISSLSDKEKIYLRRRESKLIHQCDVVMTVNPFAAKWFEKEYSYRPVHTITNATDRPPNLDINNKHNLIRKKLNLANDVKILCYQGWFSLDGRGLQELIEAMKDVRKDVHLTMMGYGNEAYLWDLIAKHGLLDRVHLMDPVPWTELLWWSASADVGVIPYLGADFAHEICSPNKLYEFIAARLPILANDLPYLRMVTEDTGFGIARKMTSPKEMSVAINEMFDETNAHIARCKANLMRDGEIWEWKNESRKFLEYIKKQLHYLDAKMQPELHKVICASLPEVIMPQILIEEKSNKQDSKAKIEESKPKENKEKPVQIIKASPKNKIAEKSIDTKASSERVKSKGSKPVKNQAKTDERKLRLVESQPAKNAQTNANVSNIAKSKAANGANGQNVKTSDATKKKIAKSPKIAPLSNATRAKKIEVKKPQLQTKSKMVQNNLGSK